VIELLATVALLAVIAALAAPSFTQLTKRWSAQQASADLQSTLSYARMESIRRGGGISLVRTQTNNCAAQQWQCGWNLVIDSSQSGAADNATQALQTTPAFDRSIISSSDAGDAIIVDRWGGMSLKGVNNSVNEFHFTVQSLDSDLAQPPIVCVLAGGMVRTIQSPNVC